MNAKEIDSLVERPKLYYNIDGVGELGMGFMCLGYALLAWLQSHTPPNAVWNKMYTFAIYWTAMIVIIHYGGKAIKNRITYRRTGFVDYRSTYKRWFPMAAAAGVSATVAAGLVLAARRHWDLSTAVSLFGLLLAAGYVRLARTVHWKWAIFCAMVAGVLIIAALPTDLLDSFTGHDGTSFLPARVMGAYWLTFVVYGGLLVISGAISFWLYLRHTQPAAQEGQ